MRGIPSADGGFGPFPEVFAVRTDDAGRSIALTDTPPRSRAVLFTGGPGMGKSVELTRAEEHARLRGWPVYRIEASPTEPIENRFARAVGEDLGRLRRKHGFLSVRQLKKAIRGLVRPSRNPQNGAEVRFGVAPVQLIAKRQWDAEDGHRPAVTLGELADRLGDLAAKKGQPAVLMVDNLDVASDRDLAAINELAANLQRTGRPVQLVAAGGERTATRLLEASRGMSGAGTDILRSYDVRECGPIPAEDLRPALTVPLARRGIPIEPAAVETLLESANGSPQRLQELGAAATAMARPPSGVDAGVAAAAIDRVDGQSRIIYEAAWNTCTGAEKNLLAQAAARGQRGLNMPAVTQQAGPGRWAEVDTARQGLKGRGLVRESDGGRLKIADPGLQQWVRKHTGDSVAHLTVGLPPEIARQVTRPDLGHGERPRHTAATWSSPGRTRS